MRGTLVDGLVGCKSEMLYEGWSGVQSLNATPRYGSK